MSDERTHDASEGTAGDAGGGAAGEPDRATTPERDARIRELAREMEEEGWTGSPMVVHGDQVVGGLERYEAARFLGIEDEVPSVTLTEVFEEAGVDMPQVASREGGPTPREEMFEDYLRELPRHVADKYGLG